MLLFALVRLHLRSLTRSTHRVSYIPPTRSTSISTARHRAPPFTLTPPTQNSLEPAPPVPQAKSTENKDKVTKADNSKPKSDHKRSKIERRPTNRQIPFEHVFVIDPETSRLSQTKQSLKELLETKKGQVIELVASTPEPIVRVTTRSEMEGRYRELKKALKKGVKVGGEPKEVRLTWGVARADLEHKLRKAKRDLEKGYRVVVTVYMKGGHSSSNRQKQVVFADEISEILRGVGEEWKERAFTERSIMLSFRKVELDDDIP